MSGVNREYKDRLFVAIFGRTEHRRWTLSLYNAINGSSYENPEEIVINTMEDSVYMGMKNDVSFILQGRISIYEQQSSFNPNMPLRELMKKCKPLAEYAWFVGAVRKNLDTMEIETAVDKAIDAMPEDYEIKMYLMGNREEVRMDLITEYNEEEHMRLVRRDAREEGREEGIEEGIRGFIVDKLEDGISTDQIREKLRRIYQLSSEKAVEYLEKYTTH